MRYIEKRNGSRVEFDFEKVRSAVDRAFAETKEKHNPKKLYKALEKRINKSIPGAGCDTYTVEQIQNIVETVLMEQKCYETAKAYVRYRYLHELDRQKKNDGEYLSMLNGDNEYWHTENSNKNAKWVTTQRDYLAGIVSKDIAKNYILPKEVVEAHDAGMIHIHDMDYMAQHITNCCLVNLEDMLQNGTMINGVKIDKPHRLITAMTLASQIVASVASCQFGGTSISLTHLAPFVRDSHEKYYNKYIEWGFTHDQANTFADIDTRREVTDAVQTLIYQLNSLTTTNGQAPFITIFMYLGETDEYKCELAMLIEEMLNQRYQGMKNKKGIYVSPAFPKLIYCLEEDNIHEDSPYWYLTELAAKVSAKRLVPDYISEKMMKKLKLSKGETEGNGDCYVAMGLVIY